MVLASCYPHNCFDCENSFLTIRSISWVVSISFLRRPSSHFSSFSACSYHSPNLTGESFKYPLISSWSLCSLVSKSPLSIFFRFLIIPGELCLCDFHFQFLRWFIQDFTSFVIISNIRCFQIPPVVPSIPSQVYAISLLILSTGISSMPNPLFVINLSWWRINIQ